MQNYGGDNRVVLLPERNTKAARGGAFGQKLAKKMPL